MRPEKRDENQTGDYAEKGNDGCALADCHGPPQSARTLIGERTDDESRKHEGAESGEGEGGECNPDRAGCFHEREKERSSPTTRRNRILLEWFAGRDSRKVLAFTCVNKPVLTAAQSRYL